MAQTPGTVAQRLRKAIDESPLSQRKLGKLLAERRSIDAESARRSIGKWLSGEQPTISRANGRVLEELLGKPPGYLASSPSPARLSAVETKTADLEDRLRQAETTLAELLEQHPQILADLRDARTRLQQLEKPRVRRRAAQKK